MGWDDHDCACGGYKDCETLLCTDCMEAIAAGSEDLATFHDLEAGYESRRPAAIRLLNAARKRAAVMRRAQDEVVTALIRKMIIEPQERFYAEERRREGR